MPCLNELSAYPSFGSAVHSDSRVIRADLPVMPPDYPLGPFISSMTKVS